MAEPKKMNKLEKILVYTAIIGAAIGGPLIRGCIYKMSSSKRQTKEFHYFDRNGNGLYEKFEGRTFENGEMVDRFGPYEISERYGEIGENNKTRVTMNLEQGHVVVLHDSKGNIKRYLPKGE